MPNPSQPETVKKVNKFPAFLSPATSVDLKPARWIWYPSGRTLHNTFVLFRREIELDELPLKADGWITADSRYKLTINGQWVQWGPAPCDPRNVDVDPVDLKPFLRKGRNVIGIEVLYFGHGEGTYVGCSPGLIARFDVTHHDRRREMIKTDPSWMCLIDRAHPPGQYQRWFLRALQEHFDARLHPYGWNQVGFEPNGLWRSAMELSCPSDKPTLCSAYGDYLLGSDANNQPARLIRRQLGSLHLSEMSAQFEDAGSVAWKNHPDEWFENRIPESFILTRDRKVAGGKTVGEWSLPSGNGDHCRGYYLTFSLEEQAIGWPHFEIDAPEGTVVEMVVRESFGPDKDAWMDTYIFHWARFTCREGWNQFAPFDYESCRWIQLHVHGHTRSVTIRRVGLSRRIYSFAKPAEVASEEPSLQRLLTASVNTIYNSCPDTVIDGAGRERQQYSGDCGHQLHAVRSTFGEYVLPGRYLRSFSEGQTLDGYFLDCWPGYDRMARIMQRQLGLTKWGPLLDHGVGFVFDNWNHYQESGDLEALKEPYPRLLRFAEYLEKLREEKGWRGLVPVDDLGTPWVWIDHHAYSDGFLPSGKCHQERKLCAFNLYIAAMLMHAMAPICRVFRQPSMARHWDKVGREILRCTVKAFWCSRRRTFVNNLPWEKKEGKAWFDDRSLATAVIFGFCPDDDEQASVDMLERPPKNLGISYPPNACWRYWALFKHNRAQPVINDLRTRWAGMASVRDNNSLQENFFGEVGGSEQFSHCPLAPLIHLHMDILGLRPSSPGYKTFTWRPQLGDLEGLRVTTRTPQGDFRFVSRRESGRQILEMTKPMGISGVLILPKGATVSLKNSKPASGSNLYHYFIGAGMKSVTIEIPDEAVVGYKRAQK